jgi:nucleotide-binding universal stress UspA family protein
MTENKIVVGFDDSATSTAALQWAAEHSRLTGASLLAVHTWELPSAEEYVGADGRRELTGRDAREHADALVAAALGERAAQLSIQVDTIEGAAGPVLVKLAHDAALLVVGTREHTGLRRLVNGSVSHYCLSHAMCPVVAVPGPVTEKVREIAHREAVASVGPLF